MKIRLIALFTALLMLVCAAALAETPQPTEAVPSEDAPIDLPVFTGLDLFLAEVTEENPVVTVSYYSRAYTPGPVPCFFLDDPEEIAGFIDALCQAKVTGPGLFATCFYPKFVLTRTDGTSFTLEFSHHWLERERSYYSLSDDDALWSLTNRYTDRWLAEQTTPVPTQTPEMP